MGERRKRKASEPSASAAKDESNEGPNDQFTSPQTSNVSSTTRSSLSLASSSSSTFITPPASRPPEAPRLVDRRAAARNGSGGNSPRTVKMDLAAPFLQDLTDEDLSAFRSRLDAEFLTQQPRTAHLGQSSPSA